MKLWFGLRPRDVLTLMLSLAFLTLASVPHTVALRYVLLLLMLSLGLPALRTLDKRLYPPLFALGLFLTYAILQAYFLSGWLERSWSEIQSQLLVGALWCVAGMLLFSRRLPLSILEAVILSGVALSTAELGHAIYQHWLTGSWPYMETFTTETKLELTFYLNAVLAFLATALCFGGAWRQRWLLRPSVLLLCIGLLVQVSLFAGARNGMIGMVYLSLSMLIVYLLFSKHKLSGPKVLLTGLSVILVVGGVAGYSYKKDPRNQVFVVSAKAGWNYTESQAWLRRGPLPKRTDGVQVDGSAYERIAWIHSGLDLIIERPLGYGFSRDAFSRALTEVGYPNGVGHSHSGFIDWGISLGVPGIFLWLCVAVVFIHFGCRAFVQENEILGLVLILLTTGYLGRMLIESVNKDHMLQLFLFMAGALMAEICTRSVQRAASPVQKIDE
ncbi:O-antigen ligase family protein [Chromobacterium alticapitis]|nr:O-antigen ligase family protein [Chromobacterium alticapitis]